MMSTYSCGGDGKVGRASRKRKRKAKELPIETLLKVMMQR